MAEPAVVDHQHVHPQRLCRTGKGQELFFVKVHVQGFPAVEQDGPLFQGNVMAAEVFPQEAVPGLREACEAAVAVAQKKLRGLEAGPRLQKPGEALGIHAGDKAHGAGLIQLDLRPVIAGVDGHDAVAGAGVLVGLRGAEDHKGVVLVAGGPPAGGDRLNPVHDSAPLRLALQRVASMEVQQLPLTEGQLQTGGGRAAETEPAAAAVSDAGRPGNYVLVLENAVF